MKTKIPKFKSYKEEAEFWDTHDVTDYIKEMQFKDVEFLPRQVKTESMTIRIEPELKKRLEEIASKNSISLSMIARLSLIDRLKNKHSSP
ncbi:hypothetical protein A3A93_03385 [Candidatus Roizmanbacteria bacterium RIFCSPLOWO2_01_FULL_38_12]|uniref:Uncharacterized protein n=1 Tax=Candidatus Roizmanbacteria bacterium RIFCSPLOWO2_01_FULL_38_12 TaxID=1802061 RepID=A0A1F7ISP0_9BACT|nr:MAG: hypothetical protein A2861_01265 [Candidatus Roizmanbacteria bacterium RIFCSPHIGHO2_01_FULL_38_15]OGK35813.1 MAG: hypothetical protein A3F59_03670 [Candidatus Roizmanbacteria bacterium RIFCSPHIGHO2_12_FULL_38_13]OGK46387.1 MAG: hypothetical protein A3A93_03385 [Candidatus Roizmanbacteria bacterium RIFCSPLOWO2_01_FULL_38_12]